MNWKISTVLLIIAMALTADNTAKFVLSRNNTLQNNGRWVSAKTLLTDYLPRNAVRFVMSRQALAGGMLNLGAWLGFQEVYYRGFLEDIEGFEFDFLLEDGAYLNFLFNVSGSSASGIRFSRHKKFADIRYTLSEGRFTDRESLDLDFGTEWNRVRLEYCRSGACLYINGNLAGVFETGEKDPQMFGFRGGYKNAFVNNVVVRDISGRTVVRENFLNRRIYPLMFAFFFLCIVLVFNLPFIFKIFSGKISGETIGRALLYNFALAAGSYLLTSYGNQMADRYRSAYEMTPQESRYLDNIMPPAVLDRLKQRYSGEESDTRRIMFVGTSQTFGEGAETEEDAFVSVTEKILRRSFMVECLNAGFCGLNAARLLSLYTEELIQYRPDYLILNLSFNDADTGEDEFRDSLESFIAFNNENNIKTIFSLEAASIETDTHKLQSKRMIMREIAAEKRIPVLDLHGHLSENYDKGFLWWDAVHLTSYGHLLAGRFMAENLEQYLSGISESDPGKLYK